MIAYNEKRTGDNKMPERANFKFLAIVFLQVHSFCSGQNYQNQIVRAEN